jgi:hypothetical protein
MRVVTLARGSAYEAMARETSVVNARALGVDVEVLSFEGDPFEAKLQFLSTVAEPTILVDADVVLKRWSWERIDARRINALRAPYRASENYHKSLFPDPYVLLHTGIVLMPPLWRGCAARGLELMRGALSKVKWRCQDEVPFSAAVYDYRADVNTLPSDTLLITNHTTLRDANGVHFFAGAPAVKLARVREYITREKL